MTPAVFWSRVEKTSTCWLWRGPVRPSGYGAFRSRSPAINSPHRFAWFLLRGPVPAGLTLDHLCRVKLCVNPDHLEPVTAGVNILRGYGLAGLNARKTHCSKGHPFDEANTYHRIKGGRACRICQRDATREYRARLAST